MLPIESLINELIVGVEHIQHSISVLLHRSSEHHHIEQLLCFSQTVKSVWSDVDSSIYWVWFIIELDTDHVLWALLVDVIHTMNQSFIHVKHDEPFTIQRQLDWLAL